jgi:hypothetical protein
MPLDDLAVTWAKLRPESERKAAPTTTQKHRNRLITRFIMGPFPKVPHWKLQQVPIQGPRFPNALDATSQPRGQLFPEPCEEKPSPNSAKRFTDRICRVGWRSISRSGSKNRAKQWGPAQIKPNSRGQFGGNIWDGVGRSRDRIAFRRSLSWQTGLPNLIDQRAITHVQCLSGPTPIPMVHLQGL